MQIKCVFGAQSSVVARSRRGYTRIAEINRTRAVVFGFLRFSNFAKIIVNFTLSPNHACLITHLRRTSAFGAIKTGKPHAARFTYHSFNLDRRKASRGRLQSTETPYSAEMYSDGREPSPSSHDRMVFVRPTLVLTRTRAGGGGARRVYEHNAGVQTYGRSKRKQRQVHENFSADDRRRETRRAKPFSGRIVNGSRFSVRTNPSTNGTKSDDKRATPALGRHSPKPIVEHGVRRIARRRCGG